MEPHTGAKHQHWRKTAVLVWEFIFGSFSGSFVCKLGFFGFLFWGLFVWFFWGVVLFCFAFFQCEIVLFFLFNFEKLVTHIIQ